MIRISGPQAGPALQTLAGRLPQPRRASLGALRAPDGTLLDRALLLWFPGPGSATGEDLAELHCHGGRAVLAALERALGALPGLRRAQPGEFTRRAVGNGVLDLNAAEGLADLLTAETELQRACALAMAGGQMAQAVNRWHEGVLALSAQVEAALDFADDVADEGHAPDLGKGFAQQLGLLLAELREWLARPRAERLRDGYRVVLAGPPNAGKSSLFNALLETDAAITAPIAGTTRDVLERPVAVDGVPLVLLDTAGLRGNEAGAVERLGIARAQTALEGADLVLWLGKAAEAPMGAWIVAAKADLHPSSGHVPAGAWRTSALTGEGVAGLRRAIADHARASLPRPGETALSQRQHSALAEVEAALRGAAELADPLLVAEELRRARAALDRLSGRAATEDMLDALFGRFCIGK